MLFAATAYLVMLLILLLMLLLHLCMRMSIAAVAESGENITACVVVAARAATSASLIAVLGSST